MSKQALREYQITALDALRNGIRMGNKAQILRLPTGAGKTTVASAMFQSAVAKGNRVLFIADSIELIDQSAQRFYADGMGVGVIQGNHPMTDYSMPVQVATIQSLRSRFEKITNWQTFQLVVIDECHVLHQQHEEIIAWCKRKNIPVIGLSATPFRKGLGKHFDSMVEGVSVADLTDSGFLVPARCYAPYVPDLKGVKTTKSGDYQDDSLAEFMGDAQIVGGIVEKWLKLCENRQTILFASNVAHSHLLADQFRKAGVNAAHVDGYMEPQERADIIKAYRQGKIKLLCNVAVLTKGFDAPETACIVIARPTKSLMMHIQMLGRALRPAEGKQDALIIDHAGNCIRNGLPDEELPHELDDGKSTRNLDRREREDKTKEPAPCPSCGYLKTQHVCPMCGFKAESRQDVESRDGDLVELKTGKKEKWSPERKADIYAQLLGYTKTAGHKPGWAYYAIRELCGSAPRNTNQIHAKAPNEEGLRLIKYLLIKRAKARRAAA